MGLFRYLATSDDPFATGVRSLRQSILNLNLPAPRPAVVPARVAFDVARETFWFGMQHFLCEPYFKSYCKEYGKNLRTGAHFHLIVGQGDIILGDDVLFDGRVIVKFAARFSDRPTLRFGNRSGCGHQSRFDVGKEITVGDDVLIAREVNLYDSTGHPADPTSRRRRDPPRPDQVRPIIVEDNVWIGARASIGPGVTVGKGSIVGPGSVVVQDVPPNSVVMGNPARKVSYLLPEDMKEHLSPVSKDATG